jgi:hypothetical protein
MIRHSTRRTTSIVLGLGSAVLALVSAFGMFGGTVLAAGAGTTPIPGPFEGTAPPPAPAGPRSEPAAGSDSPAPPASPGGLFPEDGSGPEVSNVSLTGEASVVRQDFKAPVEAHLGRYPRATVEVSNDLTTAFGAFADPGFLGRFAVGAGAEPTGERNAESPAWAECVFPKSPLTPTDDVRSPTNGPGPTAVARCLPGAAQAAGYYFRDPGPGATAGVALLSASAAAAAVDATSNAAGATATSAVSTLEDVNLAGAVTISSITNQVAVTTNGRPGGATVDTSATIGKMTISGNPVELPSDSLEKLAPTLAQLPPVLTPVGTLTFDVIPEQKEITPDGTMGTGRAAQLLVTVENGESTVSFGLGYASARGRTILNEFAAPVVSEAPIPPYRPGVSPFAGGVQKPLFPVADASPEGLSRFVDSFKTGLGWSAGTRAPSTPAFSGGFNPGGVLGAGGPPTAGLDLLPPLGTTAQNTGPEAYGGNGPWLALIGGSLIGLALARYLAYSAAVRPSGAPV